jgi:hypothetical protein
MGGLKGITTFFAKAIMPGTEREKRVLFAEVPPTSILAAAVHTTANVGESTMDLGGATWLVASRVDCIADLAAGFVCPAVCPTHDLNLPFSPTACNCTARCGGLATHGV